MEDKSPKQYYDERCGLWYDVYWDAELERFVWTIARHQRLISDGTSE